MCYVTATHDQTEAVGQTASGQDERLDAPFTSGYPWSDPIRLNDFSLALSLIGFFVYGLPGTIGFVPGPDPGQNLWGGPVCQISQM